MALDLRTARMRKDPTLLVNPIKKESWKKGLPPLFLLSLHALVPQTRTTSSWPPQLPGWIVTSIDDI